jgi:hypothetical protein
MNANLCGGGALFSASSRLLHILPRRRAGQARSSIMEEAMILLYTLLVSVLRAAHWLLQRRAASLGRTYIRRAEAVLKLLHGPTKPGNSAKHDPCVFAKQQFELGRLATQRDRCEAKWYAAQQRAERLGKLVLGLKAWKGQKLPYTLGVIDVWLVLYLIDRFGVGDVIGPRQVVDMVTAWLTQ